MPFIPHTPESLLPRSDSKNPATTCKGITSTGRPCRRALATSPRSSPSPRASPSAIDGVLAVLSADGDDGADVEAAAFFCWQHKEQAERLASDANGQYSGQKTKVVELKERTSVETLIDRLGVLEVKDESLKKGRRSQPSGHSRRMPIRETLPETWTNVPGPLMAMTEEATPVGSAKPAVPPRKSRQKSRGQSNLIVSLFCCVRSVDKEYLPPSRPKPQSHSVQVHRASHPDMEEVVRSPSRPPLHTRHGDSNELRNVGHDRPFTKPNQKPGTSSAQPPSSITTKAPTPRVPLSNKTAQPINRPSLHRDLPSHTEDLLSLIPRTLNPQTTSALLSELAKPISNFDEDGYIYIFWLTDAVSATPPTSQMASSLLSSTPNRPNSKARPTSNLLEDFSSSPSSSGVNGKKTVLLKIGRASNVHRRLNEWTRQCNYNLSLIRYYPYVPTLSPFSRSSPSAITTDPFTPPLTPRKVPHAHRVERLIHIELAEKKIKKGCETCGKEHREWFEVEASREGIKGVDEVVRRWVKWGEERN
ncbi:MAG: hypothetical protein M1830_010372 [Pleopsidium flavum]|nr:MAG: hypothetical protein M1830_010372 [Pleopsidium flavum]